MSMNVDGWEACMVTVPVSTSQQEAFSYRLLRWNAPVHGRQRSRHDLEEESRLPCPSKKKMSPDVRIRFYQETLHKCRSSVEHPPALDLSRSLITRRKKGKGLKYVRIICSAYIRQKLQLTRDAGCIWSPLLDVQKGEPPQNRVIAIKKIHKCVYMLKTCTILMC